MNPNPPSTTSQGSLLKTSVLSSISVTNGVMYVSDFDVIDTTLSLLNEMNSEDFKIFEDTLAFRSLYTVYDSLYTEMDSLTSSIQEQNFVSNNAKYLTVNADEIVNTFPQEYYYKIANRDGIFVVGTTICRIIKGGILAWDSVSVSQMQQLVITDPFTVSSYSGLCYYLEILNTTTGCGNEHHAYYINSSGDRRVDLWIKTEKKRKSDNNFCPGNNERIYYEHYQASIYIYGQKWRFWKWRNYKTALEYKEVYFELSVPQQTSYNYQNCTSNWIFINGYQINQFDKTIEDTYHLMHIWTGLPDHMGGDMSQVTLPQPYFTKVKGKASSRGVGDHWATISCGY